MTDADLTVLAQWLDSQLGALTWAAQSPRPKVQPGPLEDTPDRFIAVKGYDGPPVPNNWQLDGRIQLWVRGARPGGAYKPYQDALTLASLVEQVVAPPGDTLRVIDLPGGRRASLRKLSRPEIGPDTPGRWQFTINLALTSVRA